MHSKTKKILLGALVCLELSIALPVQCKQLTATSDPSDLKAFVARISKIDKATREQLFAQANALWWLKDYKSAAIIATKLIELKPDSAEYYLLRGLMYKHLKRYKDSLKDMNMAEDLGFRKSSLYTDRGLVKLMLKDYQGASADVEKSLQIKPDDALALYVKGASECELGRLDRGIEFLSKSIELNPTDAVALQLRGLEYRRLGRETEAKADLEKARSLGLQ